MRRSEEPPTKPRLLDIEGFEIDGGKRTVTNPSGETVGPTAKEFDLLWFLAENAGLAMSRNQILEAVWGYEYFGETRTVDVHIRQLRKKIEGNSNRDCLGCRLSVGRLMRRRMFWTIAGVAAFTGLLVLVGSVFASQRAAVDATYREMKQSSDEAVAIIEDAAGRVEGRPGAAFDLFRLLEGDLGPLLTRIRRTAGGSEIGFAVVTPAGEFRSESGLFDRIDLDEHRVGEGLSQFTRSTSDELVVVTPALIPVRTGDATVLVGIARDAPVVRVADQTLAFVLIIVGIALLSGLLARLLSSQLADRLKPLATTSRELADGDLSARVPDLQDPELNEVASAFNDMAGELEATQRREREFILGVGHDLRTPLTTIGGYAEALETGQVDGDDLGRIGAVLGVQSRQLSRLIEDLSTLAPS